MWRPFESLVLESFTSFYEATQWHSVSGLLDYHKLNQVFILNAVAIPDSVPC